MARSLRGHNSLPCPSTATILASVFRPFAIIMLFFANISEAPYMEDCSSLFYPGSIVESARSSRSGWSGGFGVFSKANRHSLDYVINTVIFTAAIYNQKLLSHIPLSALVRCTYERYVAQLLVAPVQAFILPDVKVDMNGSPSSLQLL